MSYAEATPNDLVGIAYDSALSVFDRPDRFGFEREDMELLERLSEQRENKGLADTSYQIEASRAVVVPVDYTGQDEVSIWNLYDVTFQGRLFEYSRVIGARSLGSASLNSVCATFVEGLLLPDRDIVPDRHMLAVAIPSINKITRL